MSLKSSLIFNKITRCPHVVLIDFDLLNNIQELIKVSFLAGRMFNSLN